MPAVPVLIPEKAPENDTVAIAGLPLVHETPPPVASVRNVVLPWHTSVLPDIAAGAALTVTLYVLLQPVGSVYVIIAVPAELPVTFPEPPPVTVVLSELHVPPLVASLSVIVELSHTLTGPVIAAGFGLTVIIIVARQPAGVTNV